MRGSLYCFALCSLPRHIQEARHLWSWDGGKHQQCVSLAQRFLPAATLFVVACQCACGGERYLTILYSRWLVRVKDQRGMDAHQGGHTACRYVWTGERRCKWEMVDKYCATGLSSGRARVNVPHRRDCACQGVCRCVKGGGAGQQIDFEVLNECHYLAPCWAIDMLVARVWMCVSEGHPRDVVTYITTAK